MSDLQLLEVRPEFSDLYDNVPDFRVLVNRPPEFGPYDERRQLYVANDGPLVTFFTWAGKPDNGFGGWRRTIDLKAGGTLEVVGGWSSGTPSVCSLYPEFLCVRAAYHDDGWDHVAMACGLLIGPLVDWYLAHRDDIEWGLYLFETSDGPRVVPSKGRFVKPMDGAGKWAARLLPADAHERFGFPKRPMEPKYIAQHRAYFLDAVAKAFAKVKPHVDPLCDDQRAAAEA